MNTIKLLASNNEIW